MAHLDNSCILAIVNSGEGWDETAMEREGEEQTKPRGRTKHPKKICMLNSLSDWLIIIPIEDMIIMWICWNHRIQTDMASLNTTQIFQV